MSRSEGLSYNHLTSRAVAHADDVQARFGLSDTLTTNGMDVLYSGLSRKRTNAGDGVTFSAYYDLQTNTPLLSSSSYPTTTHDFGVSLKFSLTR